MLFSRSFEGDEKGEDERSERKKDGASRRIEEESSY